MKYLRQTNDYNCVPVTFINLAKWAGVRATRGDLSHWTAQTKCGTDGAVERNYGRLFKRLDFVRVHSRLRPSLNEFDAKLRRGYAAVVRSIFIDSVATGERPVKGKHLFLVTGRKKVEGEVLYHCVNIGEGHRWVWRREFNARYMCRRLNYPKMWFVRKP